MGRRRRKFGWPMDGIARGDNRFFFWIMVTTYFVLVIIYIVVKKLDVHGLQYYFSILL